MDRSLLLLMVLAGLTLFLAAPAFIALARRHPERRLICKLSPLTLLSFILWLVLVAWAVTGRRDDAVISRYVARLRSNNRLPWVIALLVLGGLAVSAIPLLRGA